MSVSRSRDDSAALGGIVNGYAPLDSGLLVPRAYLPQISGLLHKMDATTAPTVNDDSGDGYGIGSRWIDTTADNEYVCTDASVGAAVWILTASKRSTYTPTWGSTGTAPAIGNGSLSGYYAVLAPGLVWVYVKQVNGSSTTYGTGNYTWTLPSALGTFANLDAAGTAHYRDDSSTQRTVGIIALTSNPSNAFQVLQTVTSNSSPWSATLPVNPPANLDSYDVNLICRFT